MGNIMILYNVLNEFGKDWAKSPLSIKKHGFSPIENKRILIIGNSESDLLKSIVYSFVYANVEKPLNSDIILCLTNDTIPEIYTQLSEADIQFSAYLLPMLASNIHEKVDYVIYTGKCNQKLGDGADDFVSAIQECNTVLSSVSQFGVGKFVLFSDYRVYGRHKKSVQISEYEMGDISLNDCNEAPVSILRMSETMVASYAKQYDFEFIVFRASRIYGAELYFDDNIIYDLIESLVQNKECEIIINNDDNSYVYINDVLKALFWGLISPKLPWNRPYNITGKASCASTLKIANTLNDIFRDRFRVSLRYLDNDQNHGISLSSSALKLYGWKPTHTLYVGLTLLAKSKFNTAETFTFNNTYNGKLDTIHEILLAYLLELDRVCKKHNIKYFLAGGTLLGAIRHKGFIPWDDDADIMMLREDYDKFLGIIKDELPQNLFLQTPSTEELNHNVFTKIRIDNTVFATKFTGKLMGMHNGIFVDVLSHDKTSNFKLFQKLHVYVTNAIRLLVLRKWAGRELKFAKRKYRHSAKFLSKFGTGMMNRTPMSLFEFLLNKALTFYKNKNTRYLYDGMGRNIKRGAFPKEWLDEAIYVDFEGYKLPVPKEYDQYLTYLYGDYMEMIPLSKRQESHSIVLMDLGEYIDFKLGPQA